MLETADYCQPITLGFQQEPTGANIEADLHWGTAAPQLSSDSDQGRGKPGHKARPGPGFASPLTPVGPASQMTALPSLNTNIAHLPGAFPLSPIVSPLQDSLSIPSSFLDHSIGAQSAGLVARSLTSIVHTLLAFLSQFDNGLGSGPSAAPAEVDPRPRPALSQQPTQAARPLSSAHTSSGDPQELPRPNLRLPPAAVPTSQPRDLRASSPVRSHHGLPSPPSTPPSQSQHRSTTRPPAARDSETDFLQVPGGLPPTPPVSPPSYERPVGTSQRHAIQVASEQRIFVPLTELWPDLQGSRRQCIGKTLKGPTCRNGIREDHEQAGLRLLSQIETARSSGDHASVRGIVRKYVEFRLCTRWHRASQAEDAARRLLRAIRGTDLTFHREASVTAENASSSAASTTPRVRAADQHAALSSGRRRPPSNPAGEFHQPPPRPRASIFGSLQLIPYLHALHPHSRLSPSQVIEKVLREPFGPKSLTDGFLYLFQIRNVHGDYCKIGFTRSNPNERLLQWGRQCGRDYAFLEDQDSPLGISVSYWVPNVYRAEQLVHAELQEYRRREAGNCACGKQHEEWFEVEWRHAIKVMRKWTDWVNMRPYDYEGGELEGSPDDSRTGRRTPVRGFRVKELFEEEARRACVPLRVPTSTATPTQPTVVRDVRDAGVGVD